MPFYLFRLTKEFQSDFLSVGLDFKGARQNFLDTTTNMARFQNQVDDYVRISCCGQIR